jgi:hypothetical protein
MRIFLTHSSLLVLVAAARSEQQHNGPGGETDHGESVVFIGVSYLSYCRARDYNARWGRPLTGLVWFVVGMPSVTNWQCDALRPERCRNSLVTETSPRLRST